MCLCGILDEESMTLDVICYILYKPQIMNSVNSASSVVGLMDCITNDVGVVNSSDQMEMDWISTQLEGLAYIEKFDMADSRCECFHAI